MIKFVDTVKALRRARPMTRLLCAVIALSFAALCARADTHAADSAQLQLAIAKIDAMAAAEHAKDGLGSVTVGIVSIDRLVWTKSYGLADMENNIPATPDSVYRVGSVTKLFTGLMLLQLVQEGKVRLGDAVQKYLPEIGKVQNQSIQAAHVTLEQLATMTSGMAREPANVSRHVRGPVVDWEAVMIAALPETRYEFSAGTRYLYSNIGYAALGAALGRAADRPYVEYVHQRILVPLGMKDTMFEPRGDILPRLAKGYDVTATNRISTEQALRGHQGRGYRVPNGALYSTVGDLARLIVFELGEGPESVLRRPVLDQAFETLAAANEQRTNAYGIGVQFTKVGSLVTFGHSGNVPGYVASVRFDRANKTGVIVLRNVNGGRFNLRGFTSAALAELPKR